MSTFAATNFEGYTSDVQPSDWTAQWDVGATYLVKDVAGGKVLRLGPFTTGIEAIKWDGKDDNGSSDVLVRLQVGSWSINTGLQIIQQGSGTSTSETGYGLWMYSDAAGARYLRFMKLVSASATSLGPSAILVSSIVPATNADIWLRFSAYSGVLYGKVWAYGTPEPATWTVSVSDSSITGSGWVGLRGYSATQTLDIAYFAVEYDRATAVNTYSPALFNAGIVTTETRDAVNIDGYVAPTVSIAASENVDTADIDLYGNAHFSILATESTDIGGVVLELVEPYLSYEQAFTFVPSVEIYANASLEVEQVLNFNVTAEMQATSSLEVLQNIGFSAYSEMAASLEVELGATVIFTPELSLTMAEQMEVHNLIWFTSYAEMAANSGMESEVSLYFKPEVVG